MFTFHVYDLTSISGGGGDVGGAAGEKTAKPATFVSVKPLCVVKETFSDMFVVTKEVISSQDIMLTK